MISIDDYLVLAQHGNLPTLQYLDGTLWNHIRSLSPRKTSPSSLSFISHDNTPTLLFALSFCLYCVGGPLRVLTYLLRQVTLTEVQNKVQVTNVSCRQCSTVIVSALLPSSCPLDPSCLRCGGYLGTYSSFKYPNSCSFNVLRVPEYMPARFNFARVICHLYEHFWTGIMV